MIHSTPYSVPKEPGKWRAITLAAVVHMALVVFLWFGVNWQNDTPTAVEAEVWSPVARDAAPRAVAPAPAPESRPTPPSPPVRATPAPPQVMPAPVKAPEIALEQEKKRRDLQRKQEQEQERAESQRLAKLKLREEKLAEQKAAQKAELKAEQQAELKATQKRQAQQQEAEQKQQARLAEDERRKKIEADKKLALDKQHKADALDAKKEAQQRDANLRRLTESAGTSTSAAVGSGGSGDAARSQGARGDASYTQKVGAKIKSNTIFNGAEELSSNPAVEYAVELLPDGSIRRLSKRKSSGVPGFDEAVSRAIEKSQPFPPDKTGSVPSGFTVAHKPKDQ